ncbi:hypothetical protein [Armatimonas sp.]|uniref:hypothetical protein n=1 Tax=Armatimonas sp. TaxID=1872638 RepID=UPI00286C5F73|nr:hypothetical protein [Armatimonas sp.]
MSITIDLSPEREARLTQRFGSSAAFHAWLEGVIQLTADQPVESSKPLEKRLLGQQRGVISFIADDFDEPLPDAFWLGEDK